jgi:hypothetical protein
MAPASPLSSESRWSMSSLLNSKSNTWALEAIRSALDDLGSGTYLRIPSVNREVMASGIVPFL